MIFGVFSTTNLTLGNVEGKLCRHRRSIWVIKKRIINDLVAIREDQCNHIRKKGRVSGHIGRGFFDGVG